MHIQLLFRDIDQIVLGSVAQRIDRLQRQRLLLREETYAWATEHLTHTCVKANRLFGPGRSDLSSLVEYPRLEQHLERVIQVDQDCVRSTSVPGSVGMVDTEYKSIERLAVQQPYFLLHAITVVICACWTSPPTSR